MQLFSLSSIIFGLLIGQHNELSSKDMLPTGALALIGDNVLEMLLIHTVSAFCLNHFLHPVFTALLLLHFNSKHRSNII